MKDKNVSRVMIVAGESGGHVFPALSILESLKEKSAGKAEVIFVTSSPDKAAQWIENKTEAVFLKVGRTPLGLLKLVIKSIYLFLRHRPDIVLGFGGYITIPFIIFARLSGRRTIIHEQNVVPGKANRFLSKFSDGIAVSFETTIKNLKNPKKAFLTAYPLKKGLERIDRKKAAEFFGLDDGLFTLLIMGGSQGSHSINKKIPEALKSNQCRDRIQIIHLCGRGDFSEVSQCYKSLAVKARVYDFLSNIHYAYSASDLVVSRAGAGSIFEIMYFALPSVLIPYPHASAHQKENARFLAEKGASILLDEEKMSPEIINGLLCIFVDDTIRRKAMSAIASVTYESMKSSRLEELVLS